MLVVPYKNMVWLKGAVGSKLAFTETSTLDPEYRKTGRVIVTGPSEENKDYRALVIVDRHIVKNVIEMENDNG
jgi:hypothetical protein